MSEKIGDEKLGDYQPTTEPTHIRPSQRKVHDSDITFEEYHFYAQRTREEQRQAEAPVWQWRTVFRKKSADSTEQSKSPPPAPTGSIVTEDEWANASRAFRTASWGAVFYLVSVHRNLSTRTSTNSLDHHRYPWTVCCSVRHWHPRLRSRHWHFHGFRHLCMLRRLSSLEGLHGS